MQPALSSAPNTEERAPGLYDRMGVYAPFVWLLDWVVVSVLRLGLRAGLISSGFLRPPKPEAAPRILRRNRQLRRARAACQRRALRHVRKHNSLGDPERFMPRAYVWYGFIARMDKTIAPAQFREHYLRGSNISRVQIYGMDSAHEITAALPEDAGIGNKAAWMMDYLSAAFGLSPLSLAAPTDPAPP